VIILNINLTNLAKIKNMPKSAEKVILNIIVALCLLIETFTTKLGYNVGKSFKADCKKNSSISDIGNGT